MIRATAGLQDPHNVPAGLASMIRGLIGDDGFQIVEQMVVRGAGATDAILELRPVGGGGPAISVAQLVSRPSQPATTPIPQDPIPQISDFTPVATPQRWGDERKMTQGRNSAFRASALVNLVILSLLPDAREREAARAEKERTEQARREREAADARAAAEATVAAAAAGRAAIDAPETSPVLADSSTDAIEADSAVSMASGIDAEPTELVDAMPSQDVDMADEPLESVPSGSSPPLLETPHPEEEPEEPATSSEPIPPVTTANVTDGPSDPPVPRVVVMVHGAAVDITDTGIDPTFLEALPDEMREEVINQHLRERQQVQPVANPMESQISPEFLDALPPEIRAELLQQEQEAFDRARREREQASAPAAPQGGPSDMDSASFLATLDPQLRRAVLMDQDNGFLQTLPPSLLAEASALLSETLNRHEAPRPDNLNGEGPSAPIPRKPPVARESIQLLDKNGVATLVRLLFFPQVLRKTAMYKVLANLCENSKARADLFNLLLGVLQDGSVDVNAVDRSFSQLSFRPGKGLVNTPSKSPAKARADSHHTTGEPSSSNPNLITQRCLDALAHIVNNNEAAAYFFLSEQDALPGLKRSTSRKGKGKEKVVPATHFPVVLLLALLDRETVLRSSPMMGMVAQLLATVTKPLMNLKEPVSGEGSSGSESAPAVAPPLTATAESSEVPAAEVSNPALVATGSAEGEPEARYYVTICTNAIAHSSSPY